MYIPKGKLNPTVFYTEGGEYYYSTTRTYYVGYYHKDDFGRAWTGREHTVESILLYAGTTKTFTPNVNVSSFEANEYTNLLSKAKTNPLSVKLPPNDSLPPTEEDYNKTYYTRYILEFLLSTKPVYAEVSKDTYYTLLNGDSKKYFNFAEVLWKVSGPMYDVKENGVLLKGGIVDSNKRSIHSASATIKGIAGYLKDLTLYATPDLD